MIIRRWASGRTAVREGEGERDPYLVTIPTKRPFSHCREVCVVVGVAGPTRAAFLRLRVVRIAIRPQLDEVCCGWRFFEAPLCVLVDLPVE